MRFEYRSKIFEIEGVSQEDHIYRQICSSNTFYEVDLLEYIYRLKPFIYLKDKNNVCIDVGANIGNHSIFFGSFFADHLISIEPNPDVLGQLRSNLSKNTEKYTLVDCAVGDVESTGAIVLPKTLEDNVGAAKVNVKSSGGDIKISTLDSVFSAWEEKSDGPVSLCFMKIDVEGMEVQVMKGSINTLRKYNPHIFAEAATMQDLEIIYNYLRPLGYKRMPGSWAATPVYHFAYSPSLTLIAVTYWWQIIREAIGIKLRIARRFRNLVPYFY